MIEQLPPMGTDGQLRANFHLHLVGAMSPNELRGLSASTGTDIDPFEPLEEHLDFLKPNVWGAAKLITSSQDGLERSLDLVLEREKAAGVTYAEVTINPDGMIRRGMTPETIVTSIAYALDRQRAQGMDAKVKFGINRKDGPDSIPTVASVFRECPERYRLAVDINGDERQYPTGAFVDGLKKLTSQNIPVTVHAGEFDDCGQSLRDALNVEPLRIGHAVAAKHDPYVLKHLAREGIAVEVAPTSNLMLGAVRTPAELAVRTFMDHGIEMVLGSDDPAFFGATMQDEVRMLNSAGLSQAEISDLIAMSHRNVPTI